MYRITARKGFTVTTETAQTANQGISKDVLDRLEAEYLTKTSREIPKSPMLFDWVLDGIPRKHLDIEYASQSDEQKLDLYLPPKTEGSVPLLAFIHGGAFIGGDKADMQVSVYFGLLNRGYAVASIGYRLAPGAHFPVPLQDCKAAIRYLKAHAAEYGIDPARIALAGGSSGANFTLMIASTPHTDFLEDKSMGNPGYDASVQCAIATYPPTDFTRLGEMRADLGLGEMDPGDVNVPEFKYMGGTMNDLSCEEFQKANPTSYVTPQIPPLLVKHGADDPIVPCRQSLLFAEKVRGIAGPERIDYEIVPGAQHADPPFKTAAYLEEVAGFLDKHLK